MTSERQPDPASRLNVMRATLTAAAALAALLALCWVAAATIALPVPHKFVELFTTHPAGSIRALGDALSAAVILGGLTGALVAVFFNLFRFAQRR